MATEDSAPPSGAAPAGADDQSSSSEIVSLVPPAMADAKTMAKFVGEMREESQSTKFVDSLADKTEDQLTEMANAERTAVEFAFRRCAVGAFRIGAILSRIKKLRKGKNTKRNWNAWVSGNDWNLGTCNRYIAIFEKAKQEDRVRNLMIGEAERRFVVSKVKKPGKKTPPTPPQPTTEAARDLIGQAVAALGRVEPSKVNKTALKEARDLAEQLLVRIAELESQ